MHDEASICFEKQVPLSNVEVCRHQKCGTKKHFLRYSKDKGYFRDSPDKWSEFRDLVDSAAQKELEKSAANHANWVKNHPQEAVDQELKKRKGSGYGKQQRSNYGPSGVANQSEEVWWPRDHEH